MFLFVFKTKIGCSPEYSRDFELFVVLDLLRPSNQDTSLGQRSRSRSSNVAVVIVQEEPRAFAREVRLDPLAIHARKESA